MSGTKLKAKPLVTALYQQAIHGLQTHLADKTLLVNGKPVTTADGINILQQQIAAMQASMDARTAWLQAVARERASAKAAVAPFLAGLRHYVIAVFGLGSDAYLAFGFTPLKARIKSPAAKVVGAVKALATRKARNTMGSRQRLAVSGALPSAIAMTTGNVPTVQAVAPAQPAAIVTAPTNGAATK